MKGRDVLCTRQMLSAIRANAKFASASSCGDCCITSDVCDCATWVAETVNVAIYVFLSFVGGSEEGGAPGRRMSAAVVFRDEGRKDGLSVFWGREVMKDREQCRFMSFSPPTQKQACLLF